MTIQEWIQLLVLIDFFLINGSYSLLTLFAFPLVKEQHHRAFIDDYPHVFRSRLAPGVSIIVPAFNEEATIAASVDSLLMSRYPKLEIVVVVDGATDRTLEVLQEHFKLRRAFRMLRTEIATQPVDAVYVSDRVSNLLVVHKQNGGKADSLNAGINACTYPYFFSVDADVILEEDAVLRVMTPILKDPVHVVAAGGIVRVANGSVVKAGRMIKVRLSKRRLPVMQVIEYIRAFAAGRAGLSAVDSLLIISGAFGVFRSELIREIGGYALDTVGEDMELLVRLRRHLIEMGRPHRILYMAYPVAWTEVPEDLGALGRQRARWHRGLCEVLWRHKKVAFNPRYGHIGIWAMPFYIGFEFTAPLAEFSGYVAFVVLALTGNVNIGFALLFFTIAVLWGVLLSFSAVMFEDINFRWYESWWSYARLLRMAVLENIGYRQLTVWWRLVGFIQFLRGKKSWGRQERRGFSSDSAESGG